MPIGQRGVEFLSEQFKIHCSRVGFERITEIAAPEGAADDVMHMVDGEK